MNYGLYIHVPYCKSRCRYCDFFTTGACGEVPQSYVDAIVREFIKLAPKDKKGKTISPVTVYFGGGTPGLLSPMQVKTLLTAFSPQKTAEITLETNPETTDEEKLKGWLDAGVNRLSLGVQTANDISLRRLGRLHTAKQAQDILRLAKRVGYTNITGDIMLALPEYTKKEFDDTFSLLSDEGVTHISAYLLKIEEGTAFWKNPPSNLPDADGAADFYEYAAEQLEKAGYLPYEISNFAKPGYEGKHNLLYWDCENYLGIGPAAHSCMEGKRFYYPSDTKAFIANEVKPVDDGECDWEDYVMLQLRLRKGLDTESLMRRFGVTLSAKQVNLLEKYSTIGLAFATESGWALTNQGLLVQNALLAELLSE